MILSNLQQQTLEWDCLQFESTISFLIQHCHIQCSFLQVTQGKMLIFWFEGKIEPIYPK